jgi:hypothetical protein
MFILIQLLRDIIKPSFSPVKTALFKVSFDKLESTKIIEENVDETILEKLRTGIPLKLTGIPQRQPP